MDGRESTVPPRPPNPALPYREDCWSEGETSALVDAWGDRFVELNKGNLRQKHWQEVADAVNSRRGAGRRPPRTDVQCKNRIDTLKKKYKNEKARAAAGGVTSWPFFTRLDVLIGSSGTPGSSKKPSFASSPPLSFPLSFHRKVSPLTAAAAAAAAARPLVTPKEKRPMAALPIDDLIYRRAAAAAAAAEEDDDEDEVESASPLSGSSSKSGRGVKRASDWEERAEADGIRQLAKAIMGFAEIYERVETSKQRQMMELEKQRMEFSKDLEFQRMQLFVDAQVQLEKFKRAKRSHQDD